MRLNISLMYIQICHYEGWRAIHLGRAKELDQPTKARISFETAVLVFDDILQISRPERTVDGKTRWQTIGMVNGVNLLLVAHTLSQSGGEKGDEETIRIIPARKATPRERRIYAEEGI
jgi:uncharacterized DUF497 family protein